MRRNEFLIDDVQETERFLGECDHGVLSLISKGEPYGVAVNFVYQEKTFYFHGAIAGQKAEAIGEGAQCSFCVVKPYAFIPSYFSNTTSACPATQCYASVIASGTVKRLDDPEQKAAGLTALMQKMQPEGGYEPIDATNPMYTKILEKTGVYVIKSDTITLKVKVGQHLTKERYDRLIGHMNKRGSDADYETLGVMGQWVKTN